MSLLAEEVIAVLSAAQLDQWLRRQNRDLDSLIPQIQEITAAISFGQQPQ